MMLRRRYGRSEGSKWTLVQPLAKCLSSIGGGPYLRDDSGKFVIFAYRKRLGGAGSRQYHVIYNLIRYIGGDYKTGGPYADIAESQSLERMKSEGHMKDRSLRRRYGHAESSLDVQWTAEGNDYWRSNSFDWGLKDAKGRVLGGRAQIWGRAYGGAGEKPAFSLRVFALRDGKKFGAIPRGTIYSTLEDAKAAAPMKLAEQRKRFEKAVTKGAGRQFKREP